MTETYLRLREQLLAKLHRQDEDGQGMTEYALVLVLIAVVVIVVLIAVGRKVNNVYSNIHSGLGS